MTFCTSAAQRFLDGTVSWGLPQEVTVSGCSVLGRRAKSYTTQDFDKL